MKSPRPTLPEPQARAASVAAARIAIVYKLEPETADEITCHIAEAITGLELQIVNTPERQALLAPLRHPPRDSTSLD